MKFLAVLTATLVLAQARIRPIDEEDASRRGLHVGFASDPAKFKDPTKLRGILEQDLQYCDTFQYVYFLNQIEREVNAVGRTLTFPLFSIEDEEIQIGKSVVVQSNRDAVDDCMILDITNIGDFNATGGYHSQVMAQATCEGEASGIIQGGTGIFGGGEGYMIFELRNLRSVVATHYLCAKNCEDADFDECSAA